MGSHFGLLSALCSLPSALCFQFSALCSLLSALCSLLSALFSLLSALCSLLFVLFSLLSLLSSLRTSLYHHDGKGGWIHQDPHPLQTSWRKRKERKRRTYYKKTKNLKLNHFFLENKGNYEYGYIDPIMKLLFLLILL